MWTLLLACARPDPQPSGETGTTDSSGPTESTPTDTTPTESTPADDTATTPTDSTDSFPTDPAWRSALYPEDWTPGDPDGDGWFLHDFSYAGYHASEAPIPEVAGPVVELEAYGGDPTGAADSADAFDAALAALPDGGVLHLGAGTWRFDRALEIRTPGVVVRGDGADRSFVYFTRVDGLDYGANLAFRGAPASGADRPLAVEADAPDTTLTLADASGLAVGDEVVVGWTITPEFVEEHGMTGTWTEFVGEWRPFFRRTLTAVDVASGRVTLDVPVRYPMRLRDGASLRTLGGQLTEVGLEDLALSNAQDTEVAWASTQVHLVLFDGVKDGWVRRVVSWASPWSTSSDGRHLVSGGIKIDQSRRVTVSEVTLEDPEHRGDGGNGYLFEISRSNEILTMDSVARQGRHNFIQNWDFGTSGCVWLRVRSEEGNCRLADWDPIGWTCYSEYHHSLAMANLVDDSELADGWQGVNRQTESSGAGHAATQDVFWNVRGPGYLRSLQYGAGYVVGTLDLDLHTDPEEPAWNDPGEGTAPVDWVEGVDAAATLEPASLFEDQLGRRLGAR